MMGLGTNLHKEKTQVRRGRTMRVVSFFIVTDLQVED